MRSGFSIRHGGPTRRAGGKVAASEKEFTYSPPWEGTWRQLCNFAVSRLYLSLEDAQGGTGSLLKVNPAHQWERPANVPADGWMSYPAGDGTVIRRFRLAEPPGASTRAGGKIAARKKEFIGTCVDNPFDDLETLENVIDGATEIARGSFLSSCDVPGEILQSIREYPHDYGFYRSGHDGGTVYFFTHSAIEHFFA